MPAGKPAFVRLTDEPGPELFPSLSPDGNLLTYAGKTSGNWDIYLQQVGSANWENLTANCLLDDTQPAFSPDGKLIAFRSERDDGGIFVMNISEKSVTRLTKWGYNPAWSPDGRTIVFAEEGVVRPEDRQKLQSHLWAVELGSRRSRRVTEGDAVQPQWSPHGHRIAYWATGKGGGREIYTVSATGGSAVPVTRDSQYVNWNPVWSPHGNHLYFSSDRGGSMNLWRVAIQETTGKVLGDLEPVNAPSSYINHLSFSRTRGRMAYVQNLFRASLWRAAFDPTTETVVGEPKQITEGSELASRPDLSPDGEWLAFNSSGNEEDLFMVKPDGTGLRQLTHDAHKDRAPRWSPDGRQIAFFSTRTGNAEIWTFHVNENRLEQITRLVGWPVVWPVWSPDGKRLAFSVFGHNSFLLETGQHWSEQSPQALPPFGDRGESFAPWSWSPDGRKLAGARKAADGVYSGIVVHDLRSGRYEKLTDSGVEPVWLNDSRRLLFQDRGRIHLVDSQSKNVHRDVLSVPPEEIGGRGFALSRDNHRIYFSVPKTEADVWLLSFEEERNQ